MGKKRSVGFKQLGFEFDLCHLWPCGWGKLLNFFLSLVYSSGDNTSSYLLGLLRGLNENECCNVCGLLSIVPGL